MYKSKIKSLLSRPQRHADFEVLSDSEGFNVMGGGDLKWLRISNNDSNLFNMLGKRSGKVEQ